MSSYARYCQVQAAECARRAKLASSPDIAAERPEFRTAMAEAGGKGASGEPARSACEQADPPPCRPARSAKSS